MRERVEVDMARTDPVEAGGRDAFSSMMPGNDPQFSLHLDAELFTFSQVVEDYIFPI